MKVLHVAQILQGGTASHLDELLAQQCAEWGPAAIHALLPRDQLQFFDAPEGCTVHTFSSSGRNLRALGDLARQLRHAMRAVRPDVVHLHGTYAGLVARPLLRFSGACRPIVVYCSHGWSFNMRVAGWRRGAYALVERLLTRWTDKVLCISQFERDTAEARGLRADRLETVHNGIAVIPPADPALWTGRDRLPLLFAGRPSRQKGYDILVAAVRDLPSAAIKVVALGPEPAADDPDAIDALGWKRRTELSFYYASSAALVMPSRWEGFGLAALEAMRQGRAVIASDVDGLRDLVVPGETGVLVPPDDAKALSRILRDLDRDRLIAMGASARRRFLDHFTSNRMHARIAAIYAELLERRRARPERPLSQPAKAGRPAQLP